MFEFLHAQAPAAAAAARQFLHLSHDHGTAAAAPRQCLIFRIPGDQQQQQHLANFPDSAVARLRTTSSSTWPNLDLQHAQEPAGGRVGTALGRCER